MTAKFLASSGGRLAALAVAAALAGCAAPARVDEMKIDTSLATRTALAASPLAKQIAIKDVTGGGETNPLWRSNVAGEAFERALESSLRDAGLLSAGRQLGKYQLVADLQKIDQPVFGASLTVTSTVNYTLIDRASNKTVFTRVIATPYTAAWNAAFLGTERLKLANEGSVRENIKQLIELLGSLKAQNLELAKP